LKARVPRRSRRSLAAAWAVVAASLAPASPARADGASPSFLSPAGVVAAGRDVFYLGGDTELPGYPAVEVGWREGIRGVADLGLELQAIDVAVTVGLHAKLRLYEDPARRGFIGVRLRAQMKRQKQDVDPETFRDLDDFGPVVAPEQSAGLRFGRAREHALYWFSYVYFDFDVRPREPVLQAFYAPAVVGYEWHHRSGFHLVADAGLGWELQNPETFGIAIPRLRLSLGWEL
jgi:hypothetical protein